MGGVTYSYVSPSHTHSIAAATTAATFVTSAAPVAAVTAIANPTCAPLASRASKCVATCTCDSAAPNGTASSGQTPTITQGAPTTANVANVASTAAAVTAVPTVTGPPQ